MAKEKGISLASLTASLKSSDLKMNPAVQAQIEAAMAKSKEESTVNSNMIALSNTIKENTIAITKGKSNSTQAADKTEDDIESDKVVEHQTDLLEKIEENTRQAKESKEKDQKAKKEFSQIGLLGTLIAVALGTIAGTFIGQAKAMVAAVKFTLKSVKFISDVFKTIITKILPASWVENISKVFSRITQFFVNIVNTIKNIPKFLNDIVTKLLINIQYGFNIVTDLFRNKFPKVFSFVEKSITGFANFFKNIIEGVKTAFSKIAEAVKIIKDIAINVFGKIAEAVKFVKTLVTNFFKPIGEGLKLINEGSAAVSAGVGKVSGMIKGVMGFFTSIGSFFSNIGKWLRGFSKVFMGVTKVISKLAVPITIIMGLFSGISDAIDGFKKDGIMGGIQGFITGALNSIVFSFFDLIKDIVSWVLDKIGFDAASKFLDSFSFADMFTKFIDMVFHPIDTIKTIFTKLGDIFKKIEIPGVDFSIFGKKIKFGPWKPFSGTDTESTVQEDQKVADNLNKQNEQAFAELDDPTKYNRLGERIVPPMDKANSVYNKSAQVDAAKTTPAAKEKTTTIVSAPSQVNNQTQNALFKRPVRNEDSSLNGWHKTKFS